MEKFYKNLNHLVESLQITGAKATSIKDKYEALTEDQKLFLENNIGVYKSSLDLDRYFEKLGVEESSTSDKAKNGKSSIPIDEKILNNLLQLNHSVGTIKGILTFFLVVWILGFVVGVILLLQ